MELVYLSVTGMFFWVEVLYINQSPAIEVGCIQLFLEVVGLLSWIIQRGSLEQCRGGVLGQSIWLSWYSHSVGLGSEGLSLDQGFR